VRCRRGRKVDAAVVGGGCRGARGGRVATARGGGVSSMGDAGSSRNLESR
jgi:hypothetical protein